MNSCWPGRRGDREGRDPTDQTLFRLALEDANLKAAYVQRGRGSWMCLLFYPCPKDATMLIAAAMITVLNR